MEKIESQRNFGMIPGRLFQSSQMRSTLPIVECKLEDGTIRQYDACSQVDVDYDYGPKFQRIGIGEIWTINGVRKSFRNKYHFWIRKDCSNESTEETK